MWAHDPGKESRAPAQRGINPFDRYKHIQKGIMKDFKIALLKTSVDEKQLQSVLQVA